MHPPKLIDNEAGAALVRSLADFLKASFVYPENNARVMEPLHKLSALLSGLGAAGATIHAKSPGFEALGVPIELTTPNLVWLRACLDRSLLAGIELARTVAPDAFVEFGRQLRKNFQGQKKGATFQDLWPQSYPGMQLLERRFQSRTLGTGADAAPRAKSGPVDAGADPMGAAAAELDSAQHRVLLEMLESCEGIHSAMQRVHESLRGVTQDRKDLQSMHLLQSIVQQMPVESLVDPERAVKSVEWILQSLEHSIRQNGLPETREDLTVKRLVDEVGKRVFGVSFSTVGSLTASVVSKGGGLRGHAGDEAILDDLEALKREFAALARKDLPPLSLDTAVHPAENLGLLLHYLGDAATPEALALLEKPLLQALARAGVEQAPVVQTYAEPYFLRYVAPQARKQAQRIIEFLHGHGRADLLVAAGVVDGDQITNTFPVGLWILLDGLAIHRPDLTARLAEACAAIGRERILGLAEALKSGGLLREDRLQKVLSAVHQDVVPLVQVILRTGGDAVRTRIVHFLRRLQPRAREAAALDVVEPPEAIDLEYLDAICSGIVGGGFDAQARELAAEQIKDFIVRTDGKPEMLERRLYAITKLAEFPGTGTLQLLQQLAKGKGFLTLDRTDKAVRMAARSALESALKGKR